MSRLIVVSNRLPIRVSRKNGEIMLEPSAGGLATSLAALHSRKPSIWIGWPGISLDEISWSEKRDVEEALSSQNLYPVFLRYNDIDNFYNGFCNSTIWPLFHYSPGRAHYEERFWEAYKRVNELYLKAVLEVYRPEDIIWVHDYHLMLLPEMLRRELGDNASIGFFLHIPFPSSEVFKMLPWRNEILQGLLGADFIGFHTYDYVRHFLSSVRRLLGIENTLGRIHFDGRVILVDAFPLGIDFEHFTRILAEERVKKKVKEYREAFKNLYVIFSLDRLDYTKGIPQRLKAYELFLAKYPNYRGKVVLVLVISPSRTGVKEYTELKREIDELVGKINGKYSTLNWNPITYMYKYIPLEDLLALYQIADVALITPLRDGMNLVSKEYVAAKTDGRGSLILSEGAGAASELVEAIIVNPNNINEVAEAIRQALEMNDKERVTKMLAMRERIHRYNVYRWAEDFLERLDEIKKEQAKLKTRVLTSKVVKDIIRDYCKAMNRLILLDYDGTLVPIQDTPDKAKPDTELLQILSKLSLTPNVEVVVVSGRDKNTLSSWFKGINISLVAEHGAWIKRKGERWELVEPMHNDWKKEIRRILEIYVDRTPGSFIEEKEYSLAWHYRKAQPDLGEVRAKELKDVLLSFLANYNLDVIEGNKVLEVRNAGIGKGKAVMKWIQQKSWDFILAVGDDWTNEEMFAALPEQAYTIRVGLTPSRARFNITSYRDVRELLLSLIQAC